MPSKLTFHVTVFDSKIFDLLQQMQPTIIKVFNFASDTNIDEIRQRCPKALLVYRQYTDLSYKDSADAFVAEMGDTLNKLKGRGIIWEGINEPILQSASDAQTLNKWYERFASLMHARNEKVAAFSFSTGNPNLDWVPLLASSAAQCDYIALHEYHHPTFGGGDLARYRQFRAKLPTASQKPILITECGLDDGSNNGWLKYLSADAYMQLLTNYDKELLKDAYLYGATIFQYGGAAPFQTFDVAGIGKRIADYVASQGGGWTPSPTPTPTPTLEETLITEAKKYRWMPINDGAALYKFAEANNLGYPQTDEFEFTFSGASYIAQVYNLGIVYVKKGDWGNVKWTKKA